MRSILSIGACVFAWGLLWVTSKFGAQGLTY